MIFNTDVLINSSRTTSHFNKIQAKKDTFEICQSTGDYILFNAEINFQ